MCTPDLKGTQGSFSQFTTNVEQASFESGSRYPLRRDGDRIRGEIEGPNDPFLADSAPLRIALELAVHNDGSAKLRIGGEVHALTPGEYTPGSA